MKRRNFLGNLAIAFATPLAAKAGGMVAVGGRGGVAGQRELLIQRNPVAGFQYHDGEVVWPRLAEGDPLRLQREPDKPLRRQSRSRVLAPSEARLPATIGERRGGPR